MILAIFDSPILLSVVTPALTLITLGVLRYVQKSITNSIDGTKESVLHEVKKVDAKVDGVISEQATVRQELKAVSQGQQSDRERLARLEGRRDAQMEAAQLANAAATAVDVITHPREEPHDHV